jgi:MFS family permease
VNGGRADTGSVVERPAALPSLRAVYLPIAGLLLAQFVAGLSATIVATSVPTIITELAGPPSLSTWLVATTILANTTSTPIWSRLADSVSPKRVVQGALVFFIAGCLIAGTTTSTLQLIVARALQGIGLGGIGALSLVIVGSLVAARERGRVNSYLTGAQTAATILGPVVGGIVVQTAGWRWSFFLALPLAAAAVVVIGVTLRLRVPARGRRRTDYAGIVLLAVGVPSVLVAITSVADSGGLTTLSAVLGAVGVLALIGLVVTGLRGAEPVIPIRMLGSRVPLICAIAAFCLGSTLFGGSVYVTQYLQLGLGIPPATAGALLAPMAVGTVAAAWLGGRAISRRGRVKPMLLVSASLMLAGNVVVALAPLAPLPAALLGAFFLSAGLGMAAPNLVLAVQAGTVPERIGASTGLVMFFFTFGGTVGLVVLGAVLSAHLGALGGTVSEGYASGIPLVFLCSGVLVALGLLALVWLPDLRLSGVRPAPKLVADPQ